MSNEHDDPVDVEKFAATAARQVAKIGGAQLMATAALHSSLVDLIEVYDEALTANGKKGSRRGGKKEKTKRTVITTFQYVTAREHDKRRRVNGQSPYSDNDKDEDHPYYGARAIGNGPVLREIQSSFAKANEIDLNLEMINDKKLGYFNSRPVAKRNEYINNLKERFPKNRNIQDLKLFEEAAAEEEITADPNANSKPKEEPDNCEDVQPSKRRRGSSSKEGPSKAAKNTANATPTKNKANATPTKNKQPPVRKRTTRGRQEPDPDDTEVSDDKDEGSLEEEEEEDDDDLGNIDLDDE
jgi:hypothetical protein